VLLTIKVAGWLKENAQIDVTMFEAYEGLQLHSTARTGSVYLLSEPEYDLFESSHVSLRPVTLLDSDRKSALWVDLQRYSEQAAPSALLWRTATKHAFFTSGQAKDDSYLRGLARGAVEQFKGISLSNYFKRSTCDIEMDIYRLDFDGIDALKEAIQSNSKGPLEAIQRGVEDAKILWIRYQLSLPGERLGDPKFTSMLNRYALHRYGGKLQISKSIEGDGEEKDFHPTYHQLLTSLRQARDGSYATHNKDDIKLLNSLETLYRESDIMTVAGDELTKMA
jgi:hypothetical protein